MRCLEYCVFGVTVGEREHNNNYKTIQYVYKRIITIVPISILKKYDIGAYLSLLHREQELLASKNV